VGKIQHIQLSFFYSLVMLWVESGVDGCMLYKKHGVAGEEENYHKQKKKQNPKKAATLPYYQLLIIIFIHIWFFVGGK
jgi:hypothetical protein